MPELLEPDICVIGAGSAGLSVAAGAAAFGVSVVLIEKGAMGGDCLNVGCVPSKAMIAAARRAHDAREAGAFGVTTGRVDADFARVQAHVRHAIEAIAPNDSVERFTGLGVRVIQAAARFEDRDTVVAGDVRVKARRFVLATGSSPAIPPIAGLSETPYHTNETIFDNLKRPDHLIVIGGGAIGIELAQAHRRLGSEVTVIEPRAVMAKDDPEAVQIVKDSLKADGVVIVEGAGVRATAPGPQGVVVTIVENGVERKLEGSHLLVAAGRKPNVEGLGLVEGGIRVTAQGITVDKRLKTSNRRVFAIGDAIGGLQFTHVGNYHAGLALRQILFRLPVRVRDDLMPWVTFTDPELAQVGLKDFEAKEKRRGVRVLRWPFHENDRAQTERATRGFVKVVTTRGGRILGATIVGREAGEMANMWSVAVGAGLNVRRMANFVSPYPTLSEVGKRASVSYFTSSLGDPWLQRILRLLRRFG